MSKKTEKLVKQITDGDNAKAKETLRTIMSEKIRNKVRNDLGE